MWIIINHVRIHTKSVFFRVSSGVWSLKAWRDTNLRSVSSFCWTRFGMKFLLGLRSMGLLMLKHIEAICDGFTFEVLTLEDATLEFHRKRSMKRKCKWRDTPPKTNISPKNQWLEDNISSLKWSLFFPGHSFIFEGGIRNSTCFFCYGAPCGGSIPNDLS